MALFDSDVCHRGILYTGRGHHNYVYAKSLIALDW